MTEKATMSAVLQMVQQNHEQAEEGHTRLRGDWRSHDRRLETMEACVRTLTAELAEVRVKATELSQKVGQPIDVGQVVFNPKMVLAIIGLVVSIVTGNWLTNQPIREQLVRGEERSKSVEDKVDNLQRQMEMRRLEIQNLSNDFQRDRRTK